MDKQRTTEEILKDNLKSLEIIEHLEKENIRLSFELFRANTKLKWIEQVINYSGNYDSSEIIFHE